LPNHAELAGFDELQADLVLPYLVGNFIGKLENLQNFRILV